MADGVVVGGGVGDLAGVEAGPLVLDDQGDFLGVDPVGDPDGQLGVLAVAPLDRVAAHLHHDLLQILDLAFGQGGVKVEVGEHVVGLLEVGQLAPDVEIDLAGGPFAGVLVAPGEGGVDRLEKLVRGERLGQVAVGADPTPVSGGAGRSAR